MSEDWQKRRSHAPQDDLAGANRDMWRFVIVLAAAAVLILGAMIYFS